MTTDTRTIEVDVVTAELLEVRARQRQMSVAQLVADLAFAPQGLPDDMQTMRERGEGPWSPSSIEEDARLLADFERTREGAPWNDVRTWLQGWGKPDEQMEPPPPRAT